MKIKIVDSMKGFSHKPGHEVMLPGTSLAIKAFPTKIECRDLASGKKTSFAWNVQRGVHPFTVEQDLEKKQVLIYGEAVDGYFRLRIEAKEGSAYVVVEKGASLSKGDRILLMEEILEETSPFLEKIFLGSNKQKNMDRIRERVALSEILPYCFYLGQMTPKGEVVEGGMLNHLRKGLWQELYLAGFSSGFVPRLVDEEFQGIVPQEKEEGGSSLFLLSEAAKAIRALFFQENGDKCFFLPELPAKLVSGRMVGIKTEKGHLIDIEWTKGKLRKICLEAQSADTIYPIFPKEIKECRLKRKKNEKGQKLYPGEPLIFQAKERIWLDLFQK